VTRGSTGAPLSGKQSPKTWDTWQHRSSPRQGGKVRSRGTHDSAGAQLNKEARSENMGHMAAPELTSARRRGPGLRNTWWRRSLPLQGGVDM
jgi:hypothetical protein